MSSTRQSPTRPLRIHALCATKGGLDTYELLCDAGFPLEGVLGLQADAADNASGYVSMSEYARRRGLPLIEVDDYALRSEATRTRLGDFTSDVLLVLGWQRLVPSWLLDKLQVGAVGVHGSPDGVTSGRGRSPQNWALLLQCPSFEVSIFWLDSEVDSGEIISTRRFDLLPTDDIVSSYVKVSMLTAEMLSGALAGGQLAVRDGKPQEHEQARYFPQRQPDDGILDVHGEVESFCAQVRALTRPYPGAFCTSDSGAPILIWKARPLGLPRSRWEPGEVVSVTGEGALVLACGDGLVMVDEWEARENVKPGDVLGGRGWRRTLAAILERHASRHPEQTLSPRLTRALAAAGAEAAT